MNSDFYKRIQAESRRWLTLSNNTKKVFAIIKIHEQMTETRGWTRVKD